MILRKPLAWADARSWWWRTPIFIWFIILLGDNLRNPQYALNRLGNPISAFDLGVHELGHIIFLPFGEFMHILGGSLFQCLFPVLWLLGCLQKGWYFAASLSLCWLGMNLFDVAAYAADARSRLIPLSVGFGVFGIDPSNTESAYDHAHDWYQILSRLHHLNSDTAVAHALRIAGTVSFILGLTLAAGLLARMFMGSVRRRKIAL